MPGFSGGGPVVASYRTRLSLDDKQFRSDWKKSGTNFDRGAKNIEQRSHRLSNTLKVGFAAASAGVLLGAKNAISASSDLNESINKATQTFERSSPAIQAWSKTTAESLGLSRQAALEGAASIGAMLKPMGIAPRVAATMSQRMVQLAGDMGSFNNQDPSEMLDRIRSGLAGESEPLRQFGSNISDARVQVEAARLGLAKHGGVLTDQQKIQARYSLLLKDTTDQQGDFARTSDGLANKQRILQAELEDSSAKLGNSLLPAMTAVAGVASRLAGWFSKLNAMQRKLAIGIAAVVVAIGPLVGLISSITLAVQGLTVAMAFLAANPVVAVVTAIAALGVGLVVAYKTSERFRNIVNGVFHSVKKVAVAVFTAIKDLVVTVFTTIARTVLGVIGKILEGVAALAGKFGVLDSVTSKLGLGRPFEKLQDSVEGASEKVRDLRDEITNLNRKPVSIGVKVTGNGFEYTISGPGGTQHVTGHFNQIARAGGGRIPGVPVAADSVPAMLSPGEFVVTGGGERMLERMTFPGVLNWLQREQPRHFAVGGRAGPFYAGTRAATRTQLQAANDTQQRAANRKAVEAARELLAALPFMGGAVSTSGLVPQVLNALSFARSHGWGGSVISGYRSVALQAQLYAAYQAGTGNIAAPPGSSSHNFGQAVDVSDPYTFDRLMNSAPAGSRLYNNVPGDFNHFSVSGFAAGGRVETAPLRPGWDYNDFGMVNRERAQQRWLHRHPRPTRRQREKHDAFQRRLREWAGNRRQANRDWLGRKRSLDVGTLPGRFQLQIARAELTPRVSDDITAHRHALRWFRHGRTTGWLTRAQRISVLQALRGEADTLQGLLDDQQEASGRLTGAQVREQAASFLGQQRGFFDAFSPNIFHRTATGLGLGSSRLPRSTTATAASKSVVVNNYFHKPPEDPAPLMSLAKSAADAAFARG